MKRGEKFIMKDGKWGEMHFEKTEIGGVKFIREDGE